jgi:hypothetical protein
MKSKINRMLTIAAVTVVAAGAALAGNEVSAKVPFSFAVGTKTLPAGAYTIGQTGLGSPVLLLLDEHGKGAMANPSSSNGVDREHRARLVFRCGASGCYLSQVWNGQRGWELYAPKNFTDRPDDRIAVIYLNKPTAAE